MLKHIGGGEGEGQFEPSTILWVKEEIWGGEGLAGRGGEPEELIWGCPGGTQEGMRGTQRKKNQSWV